ncbi:MAG TPA: glucose-6-phosphate isomerase, partial [Burkholderiaceae bacterium]|nr:glucose-6-phosphate isomerase [Burkholderiaceae bacterium]
LRAGGVSRLQDHLWAITAHPERANAFAQSLGCELRPDALMTFEPTIGGRYSVWSACGLPIAIAHGADVFEQLLVGAAAMDAHFCAAPLARNVPVLLALLTIWYTNFWGVRARAVMPYARQLRTLPAYLQQLEMESAGKRVDRSGQLIDYDTTPIVWGDEGTTAQHSVFQFLHQGTHWLPVDFIVNRAFAQSREPRQRLLYLSALAQADALAFGDTVLPTPSQQPRPTWAQAPGNRPSTLIELPQIDASALGALLALYEHRTFVTTVLWDINAFDQWGVEIGKKLLALRLQQQESIP